MIELLLLAMAAPYSAGPSRPEPCLPVATDQSEVTPSAIEEHRLLRASLDEPMPQEPTMIMVYGKGGHLATQEHSIVAVRSTDGLWRGTTVGRSGIRVQDAPFRVIPRVEWTLDAAVGLQLDDVLSNYCPPTNEDDANLNGAISSPPPRGLISERVDIVMRGANLYTYYAGQNDSLASLIRPPK